MKMNQIKPVVFVTLLIFAFSHGFLSAREPAPSEDPVSEEVRDVKQLTATLEKIIGIYSHDRDQLEKSRREVEKLRRKAVGAMNARVGVALFSELARILQRFFIAPSPDGLLQDVYQEALFDTQARADEKERFQFWMGRNFRRRKELKKKYESLEKALKSHLDDQPGSYLDKITRRLNSIIRISGELSQQIGISIGQLEKDRQEVEKMTGEFRKGPSASGTPASPDPSVADGEG